MSRMTRGAQRAAIVRVTHFLVEDMASHCVAFELLIPAEPRAVFDALSDHEVFGEFWGLSIRRLRPGPHADSPNGLGSVRRIPSPLGHFEETITRFEAPALIEYQVSSWGPVKDHLGRLEFQVVPGGTRLDYRIRFSPRIPFTGGLISAILRRDWGRHAPAAARRHFAVT